MSIMWMLYLADVLESFGTLCALIFITGFIGLLVMALIMTVEESWHDKDWLPARKIFFLIPKILLVLGVMDVIIPSAKTIYLMMGVSMGEKVIESPIANKAMQLLDKKLDEYLSEEKTK